MFRTAFWPLSPIRAHLVMGRTGHMRAGMRRCLASHGGIMPCRLPTKRSRSTAGDVGESGPTPPSTRHLLFVADFAAGARSRHGGASRFCATTASRGLGLQAQGGSSALDEYARDLATSLLHFLVPQEATTQVAGLGNSQNHGGAEDGKGQTSDDRDDRLCVQRGQGNTGLLRGGVEINHGLTFRVEHRRCRLRKQGGSRLDAQDSRQKSRCCLTCLELSDGKPSARDKGPFASSRPSGAPVAAGMISSWQVDPSSRSALSYGMHSRTT